MNGVYPANQVALAKAFVHFKTVPGKPYRSYLKTAETMMGQLREQGFRIVPFPPLKSVKGKRVRKKS